MVELLDSIKSPLWRAFAWRVYNTFVSTLFPILAGAIILYFNENGLPIAASSFITPGLWDYVIGSLIITLLGSVSAGVEKASREAGKQEQPKEEELLSNKG